MLAYGIICVYTYVHIHIYIYIYTYISVYLIENREDEMSLRAKRLRQGPPKGDLNRPTSVYFNIEIVMCTYVYIYIYIYIYIFTHTHTYADPVVKSLRQTSAPLWSGFFLIQMGESVEEQTQERHKTITTILLPIINDSNITSNINNTGNHYYYYYYY